MVVWDLLPIRHQDVFGPPVDLHHLPHQHADVGEQEGLGQVSAAVGMTVGQEEVRGQTERFMLSLGKNCSAAPSSAPGGQESDFLMVVVSGETVSGNEGDVGEPEVGAGGGETENGSG